ncbi:hypothetical protein [Krasilnikoviella flava]|uniref:DUF2076 domain-containing protein n=1 Tax=Krasilnikoviella flava TaxID=526729 RepID=A0A1T5M0F0_9MICO|nr:hypothetical protein [Krasilnikoviella flava]SKC81524.1 hypothetical protein SAMN04324258_4248 [Krasilnikoviella flava]
MGFLDRLLGRTPDERSYHGVPGRPDGGRTRAGEAPGKHGYAPHPDQQPAGRAGVPAAHRDPDDVAVERYRYLLRTAPPDAVEQAHAEAFARLTPEQRRRVLDDLGSGLPASERATSDDPQSLARMATRAEMRNPGTLEQSFRGQGGYGSGARGPGFGSMVGGSMLGTVAGVVIGSAVANAIFGPAFGDPSQDFAGDGGSDAGSEAGADGGDAGGEPGADAGGDAGYTEAAGADPGYGSDTGGDAGGFGDFGGDFGGGDFGGF